MFQEGEIPSATYHFKHALVQEAAYSTLPKKPRRALHARIANALESRFAERVTLEPELLAYHYEEAGLAGPAVEYWFRAARRDAERSANIEALNHFSRALDVLKDLPQGPERDALELELLIARGAPLLTVKGYASDEIEHNFLRAKELSQAHSDSEHHLLSIWGLWVFHLVGGHADTARGLAENLLALAGRAQNPDLLIRAHESVGSSYFFLGRFDEAKAHQLAAKTLFDPNQNRSHALPYTQDPGITARIILAWVFWILGEVDQVEPLALEALAMARELEHPFTLVFALTSLSWIYSTTRDAQRTLQLTDEAVAVSTKYSFELGLAGRRSFKVGRWRNRGERKVSGNSHRGSPLLRRQAQVSTTRLRWRCSPKYIYGTIALTKAWAPLRTRRNLRQHGESSFGKRNCSG